MESKDSLLQTFLFPGDLSKVCESADLRLLVLKQEAE